MFVVFWSFRTGGPVEPFDVVGTLYSGTEGLLEDGRGLEDLIRRGDVVSTPYIKISNGGTKTEGRIHVQTKMDKWRTAELAAALETINKIGPCEAEIEVERIKYTKGGRKELAKIRARKMVQDEGLWTTGPSLRNEAEAKKVA